MGMRNPNRLRSRSRPGTDKTTVEKSVTIHKNNKIKTTNVRHYRYMGTAYFHASITMDIEFECKNLKALLSEYDDYITKNDTRAIFSLIEKEGTILQLGIPRPTPKLYDEIRQNSLLLLRKTSEDTIKYLVNKEVLNKFNTIIVKDNKTDINFEDFFIQNEKVHDNSSTAGILLYFSNKGLIPRVFKKVYSLNNLKEVHLKLNKISLATRKLLKSFKYSTSLKIFTTEIPLYDKEYSNTELKGEFGCNGKIFRLIGIYVMKTINFEFKIYLSDVEKVFFLNEVRKLNAKNATKLDIYFINMNREEGKLFYKLM